MSSTYVPPFTLMPSGSRRSGRRLKLQIFRAAVLLVMAAFFLVPIGAMFEFSTRGNSIDAPRTMVAWTNIVKTPDLVDAITASLELAIITSVAMLLLLLPTMVWVRLRLPRLHRIVEFLCLLPLTIPAIALVVGLLPINRWMRINLSDSILMLSFLYVVLVIPYSYRALDAGLSAIDIKTLSEAARSLGAGWATVMLRVIVPNMSSAILNACLLSVAVVLGEYTFANLLLYQNLQVAIAYVGLVSAGTSIAVAVASMLFAFVLLMILSFVGRQRSRKAKPEEPVGVSGAAAGLSLTGRFS